MNTDNLKIKSVLISVHLWFLFSFAYAESVPEKVQKGAALLEAGDLDGARTILQEVITENPRHGPAHLLLGQIAIREFQWKEAQEHLEIATESGTRRPHLAWHLLGKLYLLQHENARARDCLDRSLVESSDYQPALLDRARAHLFLRDVNSALQDLQNADSAEAKVLRAEVLIYQNRTKDAAEVLQRLESRSDPAKWLLLALNKNEENSLKAALGENLGQADAFLALGMRYHLDHKANQAEQLFRIAFQLDDQNAVGLLYLRNKSENPTGLLHPQLQQKISEMRGLFEQNNFDDAELMGKEVIASCRWCVPGYVILSEIAEQTGDLWEALAHQRKIAGWLGEVPAVQARLAGLARSMGAFDLARCCAQRALAVQPENGSLHYLLATILQEQEKTKAAMESCRKAIDLGYRKAAVYVTLGNLYYQEMKLSESIHMMATAVQLDPLAAENIASFALSALTAQQHADLRDLLEKHVSAHPQNVNSLYSLGVLYLNENQTGKAKKYFLQVEKLAPRYSQVYYNLALLYSRESKEGEANAAMKRFQELKSEEQQDWLKHNQAHKMRLQAQDFIKEGKFNDAIALYLRLSADGLAETSDLLAMGRAYQTAGNHSEAFATFEKILQHSPYNKDTIKELIGSLERLGKKDLAQMHRERLQLLSAEIACR